MYAHQYRITVVQLSFTSLAWGKIFDLLSQVSSNGTFTYEPTYNHRSVAEVSSIAPLIILQQGLDILAALAIIESGYDIEKDEE